MGDDQLTLTGPEREFLRDLAWQAVEAAAGDRPAPDPRQAAEKAGISLSRRLENHQGVFVTLTSGGRLRGCIGYIEGIKPLVDAVVENARSAAVADPRFSPVAEGDLPGLDLELSVLTPLTEVAGPGDIVVGRHGIVLAKGGRRAVFLPQVATEQGWDRATTLTHLALKAGLGPDDWRAGTEFLVFEAVVF
jgi:AmmeMemoRadiSam system protein A